MMKFGCFESTVVALYDYVVPKKKEDCTKLEQLEVSFAAGYIAGVERLMLLNCNRHCNRDAGVAACPSLCTVSTAATLVRAQQHTARPTACLAGSGRWCRVRPNNAGADCVCAAQASSAQWCRIRYAPFLALFAGQCLKTLCLCAAA